MAIPLDAMGLSAVCDVIFPDHTHYFWVSFMRRAMTGEFAWSSLRLRHVSKFSWRLNAILCEQRRLWRVCTIAQAYLNLCHCTKSLVLPKMAICDLFTPAANSLVSLHIFAGKVTDQCDKYQDLLSCQRRLLGVCTGSHEPSSQ